MGAVVSAVTATTAMPSGVRETSSVLARGSSTSAAVGKKTERFSRALQPERQTPKRIARRPAERPVDSARIGCAASFEEDVAHGAVGLRVEHFGRAVGAVSSCHARDDVACDRVGHERREPELVAHGVDLRK